MFNPDLHYQLVQAHIEELHQATRTHNRGGDVGRRPSPLSGFLRRTIDRAFTGIPAAHPAALPSDRAC